MYMYYYVCMEYNVGSLRPMKLLFHKQLDEASMMTADEQYAKYAAPYIDHLGGRECAAGLDCLIMLVLAGPW